MSSELPIEEMTYEQAFAGLEAVVSSLEKDKQSMDAALALFERGQALVRRCTALLEGAELKVRQLSGEELDLPDVQD
jgi:exodeoxyribonuclease VII small subunit